MSSNSKKTAFVTGASSGMGKAIAKKLLADGFRVYVAARQLEKMDDLVALGARSIRMDITKDEDIVSAVGTILSEVGVVDVLVNNAGFGLFGPVEEVSMDEARYQFEVNLFGAARVTQLLIPGMRTQSAGTIVNITSMGGKVYTPLGAWYHATKHALEGWSDCLRIELADFGIRVVVMEPGLVETEFGNVVADGPLARSQRGPYKALSDAVIKSTRQSYGKGTGTHPDVIARVVSDAVHHPKPRTRYAVGKFAKPFIFIRKWFGDRMFDRILMSQMR